jgi:flagellar hook-basal body complex protein FliE
MAIPPIDPSFLTTGPEWGVAPTTGTPGQPAISFGDALSGAIGSLEKTQADAATAARQLATGQADDPTQVIMAIERARLSMEFASAVRNKSVEAYQEIFRTQV